MGVDWKSLTYPAVLPLTIDRGESPGETRTQYFVLVDEKEKALHNLVSLRLALGFQLVQEDVHAKQSYTLSMGDTVHVIRDYPNKDDQLEVCIFSPHSSPDESLFEYTYRFRAPDAPIFECSNCRFELNRPDSLSWSNVDNSYLCYGSSSKETAPLVPYELVPRLHLEETEKDAWHGRYLREVAECRFWRSRFFLLPTIHAATKKISEGCTQCDIYRPESASVFEWESFIRFADTVNSIRRSSARSRSSTANRRPMHKERLSVEAGDDVLLAALWDAVGFPLTSAGTCLISYEAVQWVREHVDDADPLELLQRWVSEGRLHLVSCPSASSFRHGYFVYGTEARPLDRPLLEAYFGKPSDLIRVLEFPEGTFLLHSHSFSLPSAFELQLCWLSADSAVINEMLQGWARRASALGLHLVPVPCDPFLWPGEADPLRGPLRVPLAFPAEKAFLVASLAKFGFVSDSGQNEDRLVHVTGAAFVLVGSELLWWWNFMLGRRWRSSSTGDEAMWDRLLADVRTFFRDDMGRLQEAWQAWTSGSASRVQ